MSSIPKRRVPRKLLVASVGLASMSFANCLCTSSGNLMAPDCTVEPQACCVTPVTDAGVCLDGVDAGADPDGGPGSDGGTTPDAGG